MGRRKWSNRSIVEDSLTISIQWLKENGYLVGFKSGNLQWRDSSGEITSSIGIHVRISMDEVLASHIRFVYSRKDTLTEQQQEFDYKAEIIRTKCQYGGYRYWFLCPLLKNGQKCNRRIGKLYVPPGEDVFGCRQCHHLTYQSSKESHRFDRLYKNIMSGIAGTTRSSAVEKRTYNKSK